MYEKKNGVYLWAQDRSQTSVYHFQSFSRLEPILPNTKKVVDQNLNALP